MKSQLAIIGGGISGVSLAKILAQRLDTVIFEKNETIGGLIRCNRIDGYLYHKVGGHVFNSKNQAVLDWFWQFFDKEQEFIKARRLAQIFFQEKYIGYPIENYLYLLDKEVLRSIIKDLLNSKSTTHTEILNFEDFLINNFGETLYNLYFKPYNQKIWQIDLNTIPLEWLEGKLPMPQISNIIFNNIIREEETEMVHSFFYYPKINGSQFIIDRLSEGLKIELGFEVRNIKINGNGKILINEKLLFDKVVFTGSILSIINFFSDSILSEFKHSIGSFRYNGTTNILCTCDKTDLSWLYLPEKKYKAHRIIYTGNFSDTNNADKNRSSCTVEFSNFVSLETVKEELNKLPGNLEFLAYNYEPFSYVIQDKETRKIVSQIKEKLQRYNIYLLGRFAEWEYYNMDKAIENALVLSEILLAE